MVTDAREPSRSYQIPSTDNTEAVDMQRLGLAVTAIGGDVAGLLASVSARALLIHTHQIADVSGLQSALDAKMPASRTFALSDLTGTAGIAGAGNGQILKKIGGNWQPGYVDYSELTNLFGAAPTVFGASGTGHAAGLVPDPGVTQGTTRVLRENATFSNIAASDVTAALTFVPAQSGANSDITSLASLTTPLSLGQGGTGGGTSAAARSNLGVYNYSFRNLLVNPTFKINQGGVSGTVTLSANQYGHDGIKAGASGATYTYAEIGQASVQITVTSGSLICPMENATIAGGVYTLSNQGTAQARVWQGTGSTGSGAYAACPFQTASLTADVQTNVEFSTGTIFLPQFEPGSVAHEFERRHIMLDLMYCMRYYEVVNTFSGAAYASGSGQGFTWYCRYAVPKCYTPSVSIGYTTSNCSVSTINVSSDQFAAQALSSGSGPLSWYSGSALINARL